MATAVNFFQPGTDAALDLAQIQRQRDLAALLAKQGQTTPQGQMVNGHFVAPSALSYLSQLGSALLGGMTQRKADENEQALGQKIRAKNAADVQDFMSAFQGTPAKTIQPLTPNDDEGNPMPVTQQPAVPPDRAKALGLALNSQNPMLQQAGGNMLTSQLQAAEIADGLRAAGMLPQGSVPGGLLGGAPTAGSGVPGPGPGSSSGIDPKALGLIASGNPTLAKIGSMIQEANKPMALAEGGTLTTPGGQVIMTAPKTEPGISVNGGVGAPVPGFAEAQARREGLIAQAKQAAESGNTMVTVDTPQGPRMMTRAQAIQLSGGAQSSPVPPQPIATPRPLPATPGGPAAGVQVPNPMAPRPGDADRAAIYQQERGNIAQRIQQAQQSGDAAGLARAQQDSMDLEKEIKSNKINLPPVAGQTAPGIALQDDTSKKFGQQVAAGSAEALLASRDKAKAATDTLTTIAQARDAIKGGSFQGSGAETKLAIAKFINGNIPGVNIDPNKVANTDYLKSTLGAGLLAEAKTLGTNPSNADAQRINDIVGSIGKDPQAMNKILDWRQSMAQRVINQHNDTVQDAESRGMTSPYDLRIKMPAVAPVSSGFKILGVQ